MRKTALLSFLVLTGVAGLTCLAQVQPTWLQCEYREAPIGIDEAHPRLSWMLQPANPTAHGLRQTAYQVLVASRSAALRPEEADLWDSGKVLSDQMAHIQYHGKPLVSFQQCWWTVRVWDQAGQMSDWSAPSSWTMGLISDGDWRAHWIGSADPLQKGSGPLPLFRRQFQLEKRVARAMAYVCGLGFYELSINGRKVGEAVLDPGWTNYRKRCLYASYDVTEYLRTSDRATNALGVMLGNGMYNVPGGRYVKFTGSFGPPQFIFQLHVDFADGTTTNLVSDSSWKTAPGPITFSCMYGGEDYDARREQAGWDQVGFDDSAWQPVSRREGPGGRLVSQSAPPLQVLQSFRPIAVSEPKPGVFVYDLGQNFSGWPLLEVRGAPGAVV